MKTSGKIKLNRFRKDELAKREMKAIKGGYGLCSCHCVGSAFSSSNDSKFQSF